MQSKLAIPGGTHVFRGIPALRVRPRSAALKAGSDFSVSENAADEIGKDSGSKADVFSSSLPVTIAEAVDSRIERTVSFSETDSTTCERGQDNARVSSSSTTSSSFDPRPLSSTLISGPLVAARHAVMDSAAASDEIAPPEPQVAAPANVIAVPQVDAAVLPDVLQPPAPNSPAPAVVSIDTTDATTAVAVLPSPPASPRAQPLTPPAAPQTTVFSPLQVTPISDTFTTGADPPPGNSRDNFVTGHPSPSSKGTQRPYLASAPATDSNGYPAFRIDDAAASQYSAQSLPARPNFEPRYPLARSSNCDASPPPFADPLSSSKSITMPRASADAYGYQRTPPESGPAYGYSRSVAPQQQAPPQRPYPYRLPSPDYGGAGGQVPLGPRGAPQQPYGSGPPQNDPWDILEPGSTIGRSQGLMHIDGGVYGSYASPPGGSYGGPSAGYNSPPPSYGYGGGGYTSSPPPPPPSYQYGGNGGGGAYGQQQQYYAPSPPSQYGGPPPPPPPAGAYRGQAAPPAEAGQYYGGYPAPAAPRRAAPSSDQSYTYKARAPAGNMPEENVSTYSYGNAYAGGSGFGGGGNYGGQTAYGSPVPGNYSGGQQEDATSYPGIELLSPGYPEFERHSRQTAGGGRSQQAPQELRYPGMDGGASNAQQQRATPNTVTEYSDRYSPPAYGSSYSGYTSPSAYGMPPPEAYGQYQQPGGYSRAPPPPPPPPDAYGYRGQAGPGAAYPGAYSQQPMGMRSPQQEQLVPIAGGRPRVVIIDDISPDALIETMMPFATLPEASDVALATAGPPELAPSLHIGVFAAALCCIIAASKGVRTPARSSAKEG
eukprot:jgi/Ulvmu1/12541/UM090_0028.1